MQKYIYLGMAIQAFIVSFLTFFKVIEPTSAQQFFGGCLFLLMALFSRAQPPAPAPKGAE